MKLSIIIPCYNEIHTIEKIVDAVRRCPVPSKEIIVIDDYSTDGTRALLQQKIESSDVKVIYHQVNQGKGAAVRTGLQNFTGDIVVVQDADLEYDPNELPDLIQPIIDGK